MTPSQFTDRLGRVWDLTTNVGTLSALAAIGLDVRQATADPEVFIHQLIDDDQTLVGAITVITQADRQTAGVSVSDFHNGLDGKSLDVALVAIFHGLAAGSTGIRARVLNALANSLPDLVNVADVKIDQAATGFENGFSD